MKKESFCIFTGDTNYFKAVITVREVKSTCADDAGEDRFICYEDFAFFNLGSDVCEYSFLGDHALCINFVSCVVLRMSVLEIPFIEM